jgi:hypothetical protein
MPYHKGMEFLAPWLEEEDDPWEAIDDGFQDAA